MPIPRTFRVHLARAALDAVIETQLLPAAAGDDASLMKRITDLINEVYAVAEDGLWIDGATRTTPDELAELTKAGEIAVARLHGRIVGCVRVQRLDEQTGEFGMLVADPAYRGVGIGRELVRFAERKSTAAGLGTMQLELLVPRGWSHPTKEFLAAWYTRIGYRVARTGSIDEAYPALAPLLATPCDFVIYRKDLGPRQPLDIPRAFADADASGESKVLAAYLDTVAGVLAQHKRTSVEAMGLRPGDAGLDVGCGTGDEVRLIAERVGASGRAVGVDSSGDLLAAARARTPAGVAAEFVLADAHALPFADGEFAAARVERALQHVSDPAGVIAQMARVVRTGGRVVAAEPDWDTLVISGGDQQTTRAVLDELRASSRNPAVGREVAGFFADAGIAVNTVDAVAMVVRDATAARALFLLDGAVERVGTDDARRWLQDLGEQSARGAFCAALTVFRTVGTVPDAQRQTRRG
jgi:ubiquinone/menaquinone biosynthesis C-methylase UbiE/GNAT superfamily N-acetyltransferase